MKVTGTSKSGIGTCIMLPELKLVLDMGLCPLEAARYRDVLITHAHIDHMAGVIHHASYRSLVGMPTSHFFVPEFLGDDLRDMFTKWIKMQGGFNYYVASVPDGFDTCLGKGVWFRTFKADHRIESRGYEIYRTVRKLKAEFAGLPGEEIRRLKVDQGVEVQESRDTLEVVYTGDTRIAALDAHPVVYTAKTLIMECTFAEDDVPVEEAHDKGHIHLKEIIERADHFKNDEIYLTHFSGRYSDDQIKEVAAKLPECLAGRVKLLF